MTPFVHESRNHHYKMSYPPQTNKLKRLRNYKSSLNCKFLLTYLLYLHQIFVLTFTYHHHKNSRTMTHIHIQFSFPN